MKFFTFHQNNTGGAFHCDSSVAEHVVIEAADAADANKRAKAVGIYFDGVERGADCSCCGDRWYEQAKFTEGDDAPTVYGEPAGSFKPMFKSQRVIVHFANGEKKIFDCA